MNDNDWRNNPDAHPDPAGAEPPPCICRVRREVAKARAALVTARGYAKLLGRDRIAEQIESALIQLPQESQ